MALGFGRKKAAPETQTDAPAENSAPAATAGTTSGADGDLGNFDLDAFAAQLDAPQNSVATASGAAPASGSAFDFPDLEAPKPAQTNAFDLDSMFADDAPNAAKTPYAATESTVESVTEPESLDLDAMFESESKAAVASGQISAPAPYVPPSMAMNAPEPTTPFYEEQIPTEKPKKKLPLVPIVGALAVLGLAGGAATFLMGGGESEDEIAAPALAPRAKPPASAQTETMSVTPQAAAPAKPGIVNPGIAPASAQLAQMKALWKQGADAKHKGDFAGARRYWQQGLKIQPTNKGFQESIAKLPK